ncbi:uncharacterized protein LOC142975441 [Anticarsia gemmatalis]|uniref:uncharacterized protein LOC142975441 n=1 Tax=Anticarsia gemmatalis TaxID=129554 RepID=UPI003F759925
MEMCRVCLTTEKGMQRLDETFITQYNLLTDLNVTLLDGMPQFSCGTCSKTITYFIEFRDKCITSETTLRELINSDVKEENESKNTEILSEEKPLTDDVKLEIKIENDNDNEDSFLDDVDVSYEEYKGDISKLVKQDEDIKPKRCQKKKKKAAVKKKIKKIVENVIDDNKLLCGVCPKIFEVKSELVDHLESHKDHRQCVLCKEKVNSYSQLLAHRLVHMPSKTLKCHICDKKFKAALYMEHHYRIAHIKTDEPKLSCNICFAKFPIPKRLTSHMKHLHSHVQYFCDWCSKGFMNKSNLKSHIKLHTKLKPYVCDQCGFSCKHSSGLQDHKIRRHSEKKVYCKNCSRPFRSQEDHDKHRCKDKQKVCNVCGMLLSGRARLTTHMASHSDVRKYECNRCPAKYKSKTALIVHINRHDGNRTKQCEFCQAKFYSAAVLIKHRRTHTGEKPYVCKICNKGFTGNHNLKVHMKVHGEYLIVKKNADTDLNKLYDFTK